MVVVSVIEEGSERMETPLTDGVASLLITIGWFVNIVPLWFNLPCAVKWKLFPGGCRRVLLIYLLCINSVFGRRAHPDLLFTKVNGESWPVLTENLETDCIKRWAGRSEGAFEFLWFSLPYSWSVTEIYPGIHSQKPSCVCRCRHTLMGSPL